MKRNEFLKATLISSGSLLFAPLVIGRQQDRPPALDGKIVQEFVRNGHFDLPAVKQMLEEKPTLLNATTDWGGGDFETALGGASHMGNKEIAKFLIDKGARMDIFCAAMLNEISIVKSMVAAYPSILKSKGPHGITLMMHAEKGEAQEVIEFLKNQ